MVFVYTKNIHQKPDMAMILLTFVNIFYSFCIVCMHKKHTFQVSSRFYFEHFNYIFAYNVRNLMYISCTFIIIKIFGLYKLCIQNIYANLVLCIIFVAIHFVRVDKGSRKYLTCLFIKTVFFGIAPACIWIF